jgi:hypothetical protein
MLVFNCALASWVLLISNPQVVGAYLLFLEGEEPAFLPNIANAGAKCGKGRGLPEPTL